MKRLPAILPAVLPLLSQAALAHTGHDAGPGAAGGLAAGVLHPLSGADHVLAMVAVGLLAALSGSRALWALPLAFLAMMTLGAGLGMAGVEWPYAETVVGLSVVAFGVALALRIALPLAGLAALVGGFALFHGLAHGAEMPETASGLVYGLGFLCATAGLHLAGIGIGRAAGTPFPLASRVMGGALALAGLALLVPLA